MKKIYFVMGKEGYDPETREWVVCAWSHKKHADEHAKRANEEVKKYCDILDKASLETGIGWVEEKHFNAYDPLTLMNETDYLKYYVQETYFVEQMHLLPTWMRYVASDNIFDHNALDPPAILRI